MPESAALLVVDLLTGYAAAGALVAVAFVVRGVNAIDSRATGAGWGFRLAILPGSIVFWPLLLGRWVKTR